MFFLIVILLIIIVYFYINNFKETFINKKTLKVKKTEDRVKGLMFVKNPLKENHGMLFDFGNYTNTTFWMKNTFISLDIIYLDHNYKVIDYITNTIPLSKKLIGINKKFRFVIECNAGTVKSNNIKKNEKLNLVFVNDIYTS